jgi:HSP20 family molecular chaperone IbpA
VAVAGFKPEEITVTSKQNLLTVQGQKAEDDAAGEYMHVVSPHGRSCQAVFGFRQEPDPPGA